MKKKSWDEIRDEMFRAAEVIGRRPLELEDKYNLIDCYNQSSSTTWARKCADSVRKVFCHSPCFIPTVYCSSPSLDVLAHAIKELDRAIKDAK